MSWHAPSTAGESEQDRGPLSQGPLSPPPPQRSPYKATEQEPPEYDTKQQRLTLPVSSAEPVRPGLSSDFAISCQVSWSCESVHPQTGAKRSCGTGSASSRCWFRTFCWFIHSSVLLFYLLYLASVHQTLSSVEQMLQVDSDSTSCLLQWKHRGHLSTTRASLLGHITIIECAKVQRLLSMWTRSIGRQAAGAHVTTVGGS